MNKIRVVELFAGVGGFRLGLEGYNGKSSSSHYTEELESPYEVVFSNQWEPSSSKKGEQQEANSVYSKSWPNTNHYPYDINTIASPDFDDSIVDSNIPNHDLLVGGFPCQDYSVAGVNTKGIEGKKGVLWWNIYKILSVKRPQVVFLENVDRLLKSPTNRRGRDFAVILAALRDLGYSVEWKVINAADYGMPQRRKRVYILAYFETLNVVKDDLSKWLSNDSILESAFPSEMIYPFKKFSLPKNIEEISNSFSLGKFLDVGVMSKGKVLMCDYRAICSQSEFNKYSSKYQVLGDVLLNGEMRDESFYVDGQKKLKAPILKIVQSGFEVDQRLKRHGDLVELTTELDKWIYLKGRKSEERVTEKGKFFYKEGPMSLIEDLTKPSRTIITSEGGPGASRFKHLVEIKGKYRRLHPIELERLNMFPDNHTSLGKIEDKIVEISSVKRAFFMGNALVVGVIEKIGIELAKKFNHDCK